LFKSAGTQRYPERIFYRGLSKLSSRKIIGLQSRKGSGREELRYEFPLLTWCAELS
jgi:hypothetical protein